MYAYVLTCGPFFKLQVNSVGINENAALQGVRIPTNEINH
jgi:hypothetical protein